VSEDGKQSQNYEHLVGRFCLYRPLYENAMKRSSVESIVELENAAGEPVIFAVLTNGDQVPVSVLLFEHEKESRPDGKRDFNIGLALGQRLPAGCPAAVAGIKCAALDVAGVYRRRCSAEFTGGEDLRGVSLTDVLHLLKTR